MKNYSIWKDKIKLKNYKELENDINVDVLIIGGGMTGISTLYHLRDSGLNVALVEQNKIGMGVTANTTGKINYLQDKIYNDLFCNFGDKTASLYLKSQIEARDIILSIIKNNNIRCDLVKSNAYVYTNKKSEINKINYLKNFLEKNGVDVFEEQLENYKSSGDREVFKHFTMDDDGNVVVAYGSVETRSITTDDHDLTLELVQQNSGESSYTGNYQDGFGMIRYTASTRKIKYLSLVQQYVMPMNLFYSFLIQTGDIEFVKDNLI